MSTADDKPAQPPATPAPATLESILSIVQQQLQASEAREAKLTALLEKATSGPSSSPTPSPPAAPAAKTVSIERPMLTSSATMADFVAWEEAWKDYARCQGLAKHDKGTRFAAIRQTLDEEMKRFIREGIIPLSPDPDTEEVITAVRTFVRRQRNPLLDRLDFFQRQQHKGESFDLYYAALNELFKASDFTSSLCHSCTSKNL